MKIVIPAPIHINYSIKQQIIKLGGKVYASPPPTTKEMLQRIQEAQIIIGNYDYKLTKSFINAAPQLKYIIAPTVGYEWIDYTYAAKKGIKVLNCPTHNSRAVAEHAIALLFAVERKLVEAALTLRAGNWNQSALAGTEIHGKKFGLLGYGHIGKQVASMAKGLGMQVAYANTASTAKDIDELLQRSDIVCLCLPLTNKTYHMLDRRRLQLLRPQTIIINVGRGDTIDQKALTKALRTNQLAGAGLDVFEDEPRSGSPVGEIVALSNLPTVVATPHLAHRTTETTERRGKELLANIKACLANKPTNVIN
jgi:D-3-phosphoglycerate dehydrogenase